MAPGSPRQAGLHPVLDLDLFRQMADMSNDAFYLNDETGRFLYVNQRAATLSGYTREELLRMSVPDVNPDFPPARFREFTRAMEEDTLPPFETRSRLRDGSIIPIEISVARLDLGGRVYFFGVTRDIRDRKQLEATRERFTRRMLRTLEAERQRVARELHDDVGQAVATIGILLHNLEQTPGSVAEETRPTLASTHATLRQITESVARIVREYHPAELLGLGLGETVRSHARQFAQRHDLALTLSSVPLTGLLSQEHELHLYRIVQEALANVGRHARAHRVTIRMTRTAARLTVSVRDDGLGFATDIPPAGGFGFAGMQERAALLGGELEVRSTPGHGTEVRIELPLGPRDAGGDADAALDGAVHAAPAAPAVAPPPVLRPARAALPPLPPPLDLGIFRRMADMSNDAFYLVDLDGRFLYVNDRALTLGGYTRSEMLGLSVPDIAPEWPPERFRQFGADMTDAGVPPFETTMQRRDGVLITIEISVARLHTTAATFLFGLVRDISERRQIEQAHQCFAQRMLQTLEAERERVARELHDDVGQAVAAVGVLLHALERTPGSVAEDMRPALAATHATIREITESVARIVRDYHPAELLGLGLEDTLRQHVLQFTHRHQLELRLATIPVAGLLPLEHELHVYRIVQEAVANVARHAQARRVRLRMARQGARLVVAVRDDGQGFDPEAPSAGGFGLVTMRERAALIGAELTVRAAPGRGTEVTLVIPLADDLGALDPGSARRPARRAS